MKLHPRFLFAAGLLVASALVAQAKVERNVEKTFTVSGAGKLHLETQGGEIRVMPGTDGTVKITAHEKIRADSDAEADDILKKLELTFEQTGNDVSAISKYERQPAGFHFGSWPPVQVDFIVTVPAAYATELRTSGGGITVGDLKGKVNARTSGGGITLGKIGADIDAHTSGGHVSLESAKGDVKLGTSGGNITVGRVDGPASLSTSGGNIKIDSVVGALKARQHPRRGRRSAQGRLRARHLGRQCAGDGRQGRGVPSRRVDERRLGGRFGPHDHARRCEPQPQPPRRRGERRRPVAEAALERRQHRGEDDVNRLLADDVSGILSRALCARLFFAHQQRCAICLATACAVSGVGGMGLIDTHTHLESFAKRGELAPILQRARDAGVDAMITIGTSPDDWGLYRDIAREHAAAGFVRYTAGIHPCSVDAKWAEAFGQLEGFWSGEAPRPVGLGECGLDRFHLPKAEAEAAKIFAWQRAAFAEQLGLAKRLGCPVVVHSRGAFRESVEMIDASGVDWTRVVFHCFTEGVAEMAELTRRGGVGSFTGILTYKNADAIRAAAKAQGLGRFMVETDAPYLTPMPHRGKPNEPAFVRHTAEFAAKEVFGVTIAELEATATVNARKFFGI
jgi:TatD DNase family protein